MKRMVSWILTCALLLTLLPAGAWAAEPLKVTPKVDAGKNFCAALDENGTVWTWGQNGNGQLGDGTETDRYYAVPVLEGDVPNPVHPPEGCHFHPRCKNCMDICMHKKPELKRHMINGEEHFCACHLYDQTPAGGSDD